MKYLTTSILIILIIIALSINNYHAKRVQDEKFEMSDTEYLLKVHESELRAKCFKRPITGNFYNGCKKVYLDEDEYVLEKIKQRALFAQYDLLVNKLLILSTNIR